MKKRRVGYCPVCDSNVVHSRTFENRLAWQLDRLTLGVVSLFNVGPWRCVDCSNTRMFVQRDEFALREITDSPEPGEQSAPIGNYIRTQQALAHAVSDTSRFSDKFRASVVEKLLESRTTVSRVCSELGVSELEIQQWIRNWVETGMQNSGWSLSRGHLRTTDDVECETPESVADWPDEERGPGGIIESQVVRKPG